MSIVQTSSFRPNKQATPNCPVLTCTLLVWYHMYDISTIIFIPNFFSLHILDRLGLNFNAINLKFLKFVGHEAVYNM